MNGLACPLVMLTLPRFLSSASGRLTFCCSSMVCPVMACTFAGTWFTGVPIPGNGVVPTTSTLGASRTAAGFGGS